MGNYNMIGSSLNMPATIGDMMGDLQRPTNTNSSGFWKDSNGNWNFGNIGSTVNIGSKLGGLLMDWQSLRQNNNQFNKQFNLQKQVWQKNLENQSKATNLNLESVARVRNAMESGGFDQQRFIDQNRLTY